MKADTWIKAGRVRWLTAMKSAIVRCLKRGPVVNKKLSKSRLDNLLAKCVDGGNTLISQHESAGDALLAD